MNTSTQNFETGSNKDVLVNAAYEGVLAVQALTAGVGPGETEKPRKNDPEIEPEKLPNEDPGIQPNTKPQREGDDDDDDDDYTPYTEPEIGDDPDKEKIKIPIM